MLRLSEGINFVLRMIKSRARISVLTPGYFNTGIAGERFSMAEQGRSVAAFVEKAIRRFLAGKDIITIGRDWWTSRIPRLLPRRLALLLIFKSARKAFSIKETDSEVGES